MPDPPVVLKPGQTVNTTTPTITVVALRQAGDYIFSVVVTDDAGLQGRGSV